MSILKEIVEKTIITIDKRKESKSLDHLKSQIENLTLADPNFKKSLLKKDEAIIAEIKKASPSAGIISHNFNPVSKAKEYESIGASALSILTEESYFKGNSKYLEEVKRHTKLPILRKDFMIDEYQLYEAKLMGADCILLIASILNDEQLKSFVMLAESLKLDYLIEVHDIDELRRVECFKNAIIGVNNRNLKTFDVDINNSINLKKQFKGENIFVSESGIKRKSDIKLLKENGIHVFLIGESLMKGGLA
ncbi:indole-3-glycerol phosphate synthase TrpC [Gammaproteobacteria bacterium]|jgi:indole-3-glycerol phosphate synthase|nr:indole-3-glycerol phosphate synthase TrpC [Gammaproteobacteria bacterium]MDA9143095.1 indole-3-glycerol phosphate synthase TrpC [Gammaproteobacteria bacterium]MDC3247714.1 indole-3-glycerol phosphate synthase TrpC [Gammaproteobacteria bacterium]MDC3302232.1 indole-3-glycerol phosphate synthase TrpC [Gammaproteobacteria bacterium]